MADEVKHTPLPRMTVDRKRPGIIIFDGDPLTGMLAGMRAAQIAEACNNHESLRTLVQTLVGALDRLSTAAICVHSYNAAIQRDEINYRPADHMAVLDAGLVGVRAALSAARAQGFKP